MIDLPDTVIRLDLSAAIGQASRGLFDSVPTHIEYVDRTDTSSTRLPDVLAARRINVYALWTRGFDESGWTLRYVGQRSVRVGVRRLSDHLFHVHEKTESKLRYVREALAAGLEIGVTGVLVEPDSLRLTIEDELITIAKQRGTLWNRKGGRAVRLRAVPAKT